MVTEPFLALQSGLICPRARHGGATAALLLRGPAPAAPAAPAAAAVHVVHLSGSAADAR